MDFLWDNLFFFLTTGIFPIPIIVVLIIFFKKKKREKLIFKNELKKFLWVNCSLEGRVKREDYWYYGYGVYWIIITLIQLPWFIITMFTRKFGFFDYDSLGFNVYFIIASIMAGIVYLSYGMKFLSNKIKRLHDNNKSGWYLLRTLIPIIGQFFGLYIFITNWFLRGTIGFNDFGEDPVQKDIVPVITIKDAAKTFGLLLIVVAIIVVIGAFIGFLTGNI